ncbi:hypothetical protein AMTR_s00099p00100680 [Amborella trichopoda]|uniref:Alpha/beta hydrolase fold-3 domain-containing protein n=1 Tax=Amborella trichopoda TaxID=13333 RepID=W1NRX4_AMBTC|nr:hypothetical protein AMTR_s00099p00100680 [Amborella trichopoda]
MGPKCPYYLIETRLSLVFLVSFSLPPNVWTERPNCPALLSHGKLGSLSILTSVMDLCRRYNGTINRRLINLVEQNSTANAKPEIVNGKPETTFTVRDVTLDPGKDLWVRVFTPNWKPDGSRSPIIVFFQVGGFTFMSPRSKGYHDLCKRFSG